MVSGQEATQGWYDEIKDYNFTRPSGPHTGVIGHFTQVVWKSSRQLGVGKALSQDGKTCVIVANYLPAGNFVGCFGENVLRAVSGSKGKTSSSGKQSYGNN